MALSGKIKGLVCRCNYTSCIPPKRDCIRRAKRLTHKKDRQRLAKELRNDHKSE